MTASFQNREAVGKWPTASPNSLLHTVFLGRNVWSLPGGKEVRHVDHGPDVSVS